MKSIKKYENREEFKKLNRGEQTLVQFIYWSKDKTNQLIDNDIVVIDDIVWEDDFEDFKKALKKFDVNKIIFNSTWSSSIGLLMFLMDNGFEVESTIVYSKEKTWSDRIEIKKGIKLVRSE